MYPIIARPVPDIGRSVLSLASTSSDSSSAGSSPTSSCGPSWQPFGGEDHLSASRGLFGLYSFPQNPSLAQEMERLFITEPKTGSLSDDLEHDVEEFNSNGVSTELDELDYMVTAGKSRPTRAEMLGLGIVRTCLPDRLEDEPLTKEGLLALITRRRKATKGKRGAVCVFCRNNGESELIYLSHNLKDSSGRVTCPVLRAYTCPNCGANGDNAHTIKYCPLSTGETINIRSLKTARTSTGKKRAPLPMTPLP